MMKKTLITCVLASALASPAIHADNTSLKRSAFEGKVLWSETQGRFSNNAVLTAPDKSCPGDLFVDLSDVTLPNVRGLWETNAWVETASNTKAFIIRLSANHTPSHKGGKIDFPDLSTPFNPTAEVIIGCRESAKLSISADENGELLFHTSDPEVAKMLEKANKNFIFDQDA